MGRHTYVRIDEDSEPGCGWGMLQLFDYHHWPDTKRGMLLRGTRRQGKLNKGNGKRKASKQIGSREVSSEAELNKVKTSDSQSAHKNHSQDEAIKALMGEEIYIQTDAKPRAPHFPNKRYSFLRILPHKSSNVAIEDHSNAVWSEFIAKLQDFLHLGKSQFSHSDFNEKQKHEKAIASEDPLGHKALHYGELKRCLAFKDSEGNFNDLEKLKVKKELFLQILHNGDAVLPSQMPLSRQQVYSSTIKLFKSMSFPSANSFHTRFRTPSKLEQKHNEVWPLSNGKNLSQTPKNTEGDQLDAKASSSKRNLESSQIPIIRRSASLTDSMDRYAKLLGYSIGKEMTSGLSRSLKVRNEKEFASEEYSHKSLRRTLGIPDLGSYNVSQSEAYRDAFSAEIMMSSILENSKRVSESHEFSNETEGTRESTDGSDAVSLSSVEHPISIRRAEDETDGMPGTEAFTLLTSEEEEFSMEGEVCTHSIQQHALPKIPDSVPQKISNANFPTPEGPHSEPDCVPKLLNSESICNLDANFVEESIMRTHRKSSHGYQDTPYILESLFHINRDEMLDSDFCLVRRILELSGLMSKDQHQMRLLLEQQLDPALLNEAEKGLVLEPKFSSKTVAGNDCHNKIVFDLVDQALLRISERSCMYYPKALSSSCRVSPVPTGAYILEEVWASVRNHLRWRSDFDLQSEAIVACDFFVDEGWMSLQFESECIALQLEDLIFNELLDELIS